MDSGNNNEQVLHTPLFDRFLSEKPADLQSLARDIADIVGARRAHSGPGIVGWGLSGADRTTGASADDRKRLASDMAAAIEKFEPRLSGVTVVPELKGSKLRFRVSANLLFGDTRTVVLSVLGPNRNGSLGASVTLDSTRS